MSAAENSSSPNATPGQWEQTTFTLRNGKVANPWLALTALMFGFFMSLLDVTIVNIALSDIVTKLNTDLTTATWVLNAYSLVFAVLLVSIGRFADQFGRKLTFMIGMVVFSLGSLLCAIAPSIEVLIAARAFQAIGAAALNPISLAIIISIFPPQKRGAAIGVWGASSGIASAIGPVLGGFLVQNFDWRAIFYVNLPFCIIGLIMVALFVPETRQPSASKGIDLPGLLTLSISMFCLVLAIMQGNTWGWNSPTILGLFATMVVCLVLFVFIEARQKDPIVDFSLFKIRSFTASNISMFLFGIAIQGAFLMTVLYYINAQGYDQLNAAYAILPIPLTAFVVSALSGAFSLFLNPRIMGTVGLAALAVGFMLTFFTSVDTSYPDMAWRLAILGIGMGLCFQNFPAFALSDVPRAKLGVGSGIFNTFRQIGFALGIAILIAVFTNQITPNINQAQQNSIQIVNQDNKLPPQLRDGIVTGLKKSTASSTTSGEAAASSSANQNSFDLTKLADQIPGPAGQALKPELKSLNDSITREFKAGAIDTFRLTWLISAIFAAIGTIVSLLTAIERRKPAEVADGEPPVVMATH
ncbi:DHA2 family efflux MFS transporter permease subunit [Ktedonobacter racemifer]|uniref:Drug resistance transporter, EmrB/QacA subfamily n=1 Tax=Ktedonobacter racemifer DSM 44963 TaxID=485913 RepID=D6U4H0_KTERA|nr:DHA2 family efflux MFS transporter permease subunit [Ktedonobacter racemifer]EFH81400.1 drug resistance transporter, EmrB/QacA subfamily [Ktedonobacter racemifer DSM 44963]